MKKFIFASPYQKPDRFDKGIYHASGNEKLNYDTETHFPIISVINGYADENDSIEIVAVVSDYSNAKTNYKTFLDELDAIANEKNLKVKLTPVEIPYGDELDIQLEMFSKLIECTADDDELFCDITYGTKVMSQILTMAVNYGYRIHSNVTLGCMVYAAKDFNGGIMKIYDITSLNYMDEIVRMFAENKIKNPTDKIKELLK